MTNRTAGTEGVRPLRLNSFAFPSDTTWRFLLLVVATVGSALFLYSSLFFWLPGERERARAAAECAEQVRSLPPVTNADMDRYAQALGDCYGTVNRREITFALGSLAALVSVTVGLYLLTPRWKIRRRRLVPLTSQDAPEVVACFDGLCAEAGLSRRPALLWNPLTRGGGALAFAAAGRDYVAVGAGLVSQYYLNRGVFVAVLRHELAHLTNRDVNKTYLTVSIWRAFLVAALLPAVLFHLSLVRTASGVVNVGATVWRASLLAVLVYLTRNATLRAREYYADVVPLCSRTTAPSLASSNPSRGLRCGDA